MNKLSQSENRFFYKRLLTLGLPMLFQQFVSSFINLLDTFMLGSVSEASLTAAGLANKLFFVYALIVYGITTGAAIFISQFYGKGDIKSAQKYLGISLVISASIGVIFSFIAYFIPEKIMGVYTQSDEVISEGVKYLQIVTFCYLTTALSTCFYTALKSTHHPYIPLMFTSLALIINLVLNAVFIYGLKLGIQGAAYTTVIARSVEFIGIFITVKIKNTPLKAPMYNYFKLKLSDFSKYFKVAGFVIITEIVWSVGTALYAVSYKKFGTSSQAAIQVTDTCTMLFIVIAFALGNAASVIIGNTIGEGKHELAQSYAQKFWLLSIIVGVIIGSIVAAFSPLLPLIFPELTIEGKTLASRCLLFMGLVMPIRCLEFMLMVGILRSGGDTKFAVFCDITSVWILTLPILYLAVSVFNVSFVYVFLLTYSEMLYKCFLGSIRLFKSRKWLHNVTIKG